MNIGNYVKKKNCDKIAIIDAQTQKKLTYDEFDILSDNIAQNLINLGFKNSDILMVMLENSIELQLCYFSCFKIGAIIQPLNYFITKEEILFASKSCKPKAFITNNFFWKEKLQSIKHKMDWIEHFFCVTDKQEELNGSNYFDELLKKSEARKFPTVKANDFGQLFFVFSKEKSKFDRKGVLLTHNIMEWHSKPYELLGLSSDDVVAGILHPYNALTRAVFKAGATYVIFTHFTGEFFLNSCRKYGITFLGGTPMQFQKILKAGRKINYFPNTIRSSFCVGNIPEKSLWKEFENSFMTRIYGGMGCKELGIFSIEPYDTPTKYGSIGKVLPYMEYELFNKNGIAFYPNKRNMKRGILNIKSHSRISHYWINDKIVLPQNINNWFSTGYEVIENKDGYLFLTGKILDHSISGEKRYYNIK